MTDMTLLRMEKSRVAAAAPSKSMVASHVAFAIKAPVSMLVLPVLWKFLGPIKFVHVVREYVHVGVAILLDADFLTS